MESKVAVADLSDQEILSQVEDVRRTIFKLRNQKSLNKKMEKPHLLKEAKRALARLLMEKGNRARMVVSSPFSLAEKSKLAEGAKGESHG